MKFISKVFLVLIFLSNTMFALNAKIVVIPFEKWIKTFGVSSLEKSLLKSAKYTYSAGKLVAKRNDTFFPNMKDAVGQTNIQRMEKGLAPIGKDGKSIELHHLKQKDNGIIVELTSMEHKSNSNVLHQYRIQSEIDRQSFNSFKSQYWKERAMDFK